MQHIGFAPDGNKVYQDPSGGEYDNNEFGMPGCNCMYNEAGKKQLYEGPISQGVNFDKLVAGAKSMNDLASRFFDAPEMFEPFAQKLGQMIEQGVNAMPEVVDMTMPQ